MMVDPSIVESVATNPPRTVGDFVDRVFFPWAPTALKESTIDLYLERYRTWIAPTWHDAAWSDVTPLAVLAWVAVLARSPTRTPPFRPMAPRTVRHLHATLSGMLQLAVICGLLPHNSARAVREALPLARPAPFKRTQPKRWRLEEVRMALRSNRIPAYRRVEFLVAILTLCRPGEVRALTWRCVRVVDGAPCLLVETTDDKEETKTGPARIVPLHPEAVDALVAWRKSWPRLFSRTPDDGDPIFPGRYSYGYAARGRNDQGYFALLLSRAGVPMITPHGLRKTGAQLYRNAGVPPRDIALLLGHEDGTSTGAYVSDDEIPPGVLLSSMRRLCVLGNGAGNQILDGPGRAALSVQPMQPILPTGGSTAREFREVSAQPSFPISSNQQVFAAAPADRVGTHDSPALAGEPTHDLVAPFVALEGHLENVCALVVRLGDEPEAASFKVDGIDGALELARKIVLTSAGSRIDAVDHRGVVVGTRVGPDARPARRAPLSHGGGLVR